MTAVEEDGDDVGYTRISDGCFRFECQTWDRGKPVRPQLVRRRQGGGLFWCCPKCDYSYGPVRRARMGEHLE